MLERFRIAFGIAAMAVEHIEIDEIVKIKPVRIGIQSVDRLVDDLLVILTP